jgi:hypothetical protein
MRGGALAVVLISFAAGPAGGEWLVLRDGSTIETRGPVESKGKLVVFRTAAGTLASLRREQIDADATERANRRQAEATAPARAPAAAAARAPVLVLREDDLPKGVAPAAATNQEGGDAAPEPPAPAGVQVGTWERVATTDGGGTEIVGTLQNGSGRVMEVLAVKVVALDAAGKILATVSTQPARPELPPGESTGFSARLTGLPPDGFSGARFEVQSRPLRDDGADPAEPQPPQTR